MIPLNASYCPTCAALPGEQHAGLCPELSVPGSSLTVATGKGTGDGGNISLEEFSKITYCDICGVPSDVNHHPMCYSADNPAMHTQKCVCDLHTTLLPYGCRCGGS